MPLIHNQTSLPLEAGKSLFDYADDLAVRVPTSCNRNGECHECIVEVRRKGMHALEPLNDTEEFLRENYRLACQARVIDIEADIEFNILRRQPRILTESIERSDIELDPLTVREGDNIIFKGESLPPPLRGGTKGGGPRIIDRLPRPHPWHRSRHRHHDRRNEPRRPRNRRHPIHCIIRKPTTLRRLRRHAPHLLRHRRVPGRTTSRPNLKHQLRDRRNGARPQNPTPTHRRIRCRRKHHNERHPVRNRRRTHRTETLQIPHRNRTSPEGKRDTTALNIRQAHEIGIRINPNANIYSGPLIASHIGSDVAADLLTIAIDEQDDIVMLIDIGTNTEIIAGNKHQLHAASCPAGPAFEGGNVTYAMPGYNGAVERVKIPDSDPVGAFRETPLPETTADRRGNPCGCPDYDRSTPSETDAVSARAGIKPAPTADTGADHTPLLTTIGNTPPIGICGSGLIDLLAELRRHNIMNELGNFNDGSDEFTFHHENRLTLSRADISALAQAKAANYCGQNIVLETTQTTACRLHPTLPSRRLCKLHQHPKRHQHRLHPQHPDRPHNQNRQRIPTRRNHNAHKRHQTSRYRTTRHHHHPHRTRNQPQLLRPLRRRLPIQKVKTSFRRKSESRG